LQVDDVKTKHVESWLQACCEAGLVRLYVVDGKEYLEILRFNQQRRSASRCPEPISIDINFYQLQSIEHLGVGEGVGEGVEKISNPNGLLVETREASSDLAAPTDADKEATDAASPRCPIAEIVALYHAALPELPRVVKLTTARSAAIRQRWREDLEKLDDWRAYFADVRKSRFLMGKTSPRDGRKPFVASLPWLVKAENFAKVAEGKYHEEST
jgi:hypothetical protein